MSENPKTEAEWIAHFDTTGEEKVRTDFRGGRYGGLQWTVADGWLRGRDAAREEQRHADAIDVGKTANLLADQGNRLVFVSLLASLVAIVLSIVALLK